MATANLFDTLATYADGVKSGAFDTDLDDVTRWDVWRTLTALVTLRLAAPSREQLVSITGILLRGDSNGDAAYLRTVEIIRNV